MTCRIGTTAWIAKRGCGDDTPRMVDPDFVMVTRWPPFCFGQNMAVGNVAAPVPSKRMLVLEPTVKMAVKIGTRGRGGKAGSGNEQDRDQENHLWSSRLHLKAGPRSAGPRSAGPSPCRNISRI